MLSFKYIDALGEFIIDLFWAIVYVPSEASKWWRDGHTRTEWLRVHEGIWDYDRESEQHASRVDYALWHLLGGISDALILGILLTIAVLVLVTVV